MGVVHRYWLVVLLVLGGPAACGSPQTDELALAAPVVYSAAAETADEFVTYSDPDYGFTLDLPRDWYAGELAGTTDGLIVASNNQPDLPRAAISVVVEEAAQGQDLTAAASAAEETLRGQPEIAQFSRELARPATVNGLTGQERIYRYASAGQIIHQRTVYLAGPSALYAISLIAPQGLFGEHEALFKQVLSSFKEA